MKLNCVQERKSVAKEKKIFEGKRGGWWGFKGKRDRGNEGGR